MNKRANQVFDLYNSFKLQSITSRRFNQAQMLEWISDFLLWKTVEAEPLGKSAEGRTISLYSYGSGATTILLWSQMHGDEPTATMALMDMLSFLAKNPNHEISKAIMDSLTLRMIPMLNPDGAESFTRRTAQIVDMNRDARALQTPEARILKAAREQLKPGFAFNMHDQDPRYTVSITREITAMALLAPALDEGRTDNAIRTRAKKIAAVFAEAMNEFIPQNLAKWDDTYEPRAFGDSFQRWGTSTLLVESGGWRNDRDKMFLRKLNCVGLLTTLAAIADGSYETANTQVYERIPFNTKLAYDLIIRNAQFKANEFTPAVSVDVGINYEESMGESGKVLHSAKIMDLGDLSTFTSFEVIDAKGKMLDASHIAIEKTIARNDAQSLFL